MCRHYWAQTLKNESHLPWANTVEDVCLNYSHQTLGHPFWSLSVSILEHETCIKCTCVLQLICHRACSIHHISSLTDPSSQWTETTTLEFVFLSTWLVTTDLMTKSRNTTQTEFADGDMHPNIASQLSRGHVPWLLSLYSWTSVAQLLRWHSEACILSLVTTWFRTCMPHLLNLHSWACITTSQNPQFRTYACHCCCCC